MTHINVDITDRLSERLRMHMLEAERKFWCDMAYELQRELETIPQAVREYGFVEISDRRESVKLVAAPDGGEA